jgi:hypothetical protein
LIYSEVEQLKFNNISLKRFLSILYFFCRLVNLKGSAASKLVIPIKG